MERLNLIFDSMLVASASENLKKLAAEHPLNITVTGTLERCLAVREEMLTLLASIKPTFTFGIGSDMALATAEIHGQVVKRLKERDN